MGSESIMCNHHKLHFVLLFFLAFFTFLLILSEAENEERFSEELLLRPLPDGKVLAHFQFTHQLPPVKSYGQHHVLFPKAIFQLVQKFRIREMELSFTQGRWNYNQWGGVDPLTRQNAKPSGVELWSAFAVPDDQMDSTWGNLTHALSGLFCASMNFLESPVMTANPVRAFLPHQDKPIFSSCDTVSQKSLIHDPVFCQAEGLNGKTVAGKVKNVRYGALPREAVCTENLTPWLKLLPCRDKAGLATLLDRPTIYKPWYHSLRLHVRSDEFELPPGNLHTGTTIGQTLTLVLDPSDSTFGRPETGPKVHPSWTLSKLFGRDLSGKCPLSSYSAAFLEFDGPLVQRLNIGKEWNQWVGVCKAGMDDKDCNVIVSNSGGAKLLSKFKNNEIFRVNGEPVNLSLDIRDNENLSPAVLFTFSIPNQGDHSLLSLGLTWKVPFSWTPIRGPFRATRFLVGSGNAKGAISIVLKSNKEIYTEYVDNLPSFGGFKTRSVVLFQIVPWYIRLYLHTFKILVDEKSKPFREVVKWMHVVPSEDRKSPGVIEMELILPSNATVITLTTEFDKGFLRIDEHPPDANRGFDLPSALLYFPYQRSKRKYTLMAGSNGADVAQSSPLLQEFQNENHVQVYTEPLLVPLATPDFSMPYNVITLTCTVLALYFGSLLNILRRRVGEEERLAKSKEQSKRSKLDQILSRVLRGRNASKVSGLVKFVLVAAIAVFVNYYFMNA